MPDTGEPVVINMPCGCAHTFSGWRGSTFCEDHWSGGGAGVARANARNAAAGPVAPGESEALALLKRYQWSAHTHWTQWEIEARELVNRVAGRAEAAEGKG